MRILKNELYEVMEGKDLIKSRAFQCRARFRCQGKQPKNSWEWILKVSELVEAILGGGLKLLVLQPMGIMISEKFLD